MLLGPVARVAFLREVHLGDGNGNNDRKWAEPLSSVYSLRIPVNKHLTCRPEEGWVLLIFLTLRADDAI